MCKPRVEGSGPGITELLVGVWVSIAACNGRGERTMAIYRGETWKARGSVWVSIAACNGREESTMAVNRGET